MIWVYPPPSVIHKPHAMPAFMPNIESTSIYLYLSIRSTTKHQHIQLGSIRVMSGYSRQRGYSVRMLATNSKCSNVNGLYTYHDSVSSRGWMSYLQHIDFQNVARTSHLRRPERHGLRPSVLRQHCWASQPQAKWLCTREATKVRLFR